MDMFFFAFFSLSFHWESLYVVDEIFTALETGSPMMADDVKSFF